MQQYARLGLVLAVNAVLMFLITFVTIRSAGHFHVNINRVWMALLMVAPMAILMLLSMRAIFTHERLNMILIGAFAALWLILFIAVRAQVPVGNEQFLRSMIPHHSGALLMCEEASINDSEIEELCARIVKTQTEEIAQMERILARY
jgi:hypothetical protein